MANNLGATHTYGLWHIYSRTPTYKLITVHLRRTVISVSSIVKRTVHRVVHFMQSYHGAPLLELSSYSFSKYMKFVSDVDLASTLLPVRTQSRREIRKNEA